jgi:hypothetical protein
VDGVVVGVADEVSVGVGEPLVESDGLADGEAEGDLVGLGVLLGFGLPVGRGVLDGSTRARLGLEVGLREDGLLVGDVGVTGGELRCWAVLLRTSPVVGLALWLVR